jgi:ATP-dependent RNA helicase RhlB
MEFQEFNLHPDLQRGIAEAGYVSCMPVQEQVLTNAFGGQDLYVQSQTGTGKTAAFLIVIFQRLLTEPVLNGKKAIIMVPTRELAVQVEEEAKALGKYLPFKIGSFYGGVGYTEQQRLLKDNVQILVGTPGRVLDLNSSGRMNLMEIAFLVLDEADRMFDMGFYPDLRKLIRVVPPADRRQTMLFSATLNNWVKNLAWEYTKSPREIEITPEKVTVEEIEQVLYHVPSGDKMKLLMGLLERDKPESAIIFCNTKRYAEIVAKRLRLNGIDCEFIMGDLPQAKRLKIIEDVKAGKTRFLVATDVAARGLDIEDLALVVNYDLPVETENYVHRIGRTARAGKSGKAVTLASEQDVYELPDIERYLGKKIPAEIAGAELYGEDKSEGVRIRTDFFSPREDRDRRGDSRYGSRDRGPDRRGGRGDTRRPDRRRDEAPPGRREDRDRDAPRRESFGRGGRESRESAGRESRETASRENPARGGRDRQSAGVDQDLTRLSFDQRMAYYKRKYEGGHPREREPSAAENREKPPERSRRQRGEGGREQAPRDKQPREGDALGKGQTSRGKPPRQNRGPRAKPESPGAQAAPRTEAPPKKGLLGRILGAFKKKP